MTTRTVTITQAAAAATEVPFQLRLQTPLGRLWELLRAARFEGVDELEVSLMREGNRALVQFYVGQVLPRDPEEILEISEAFEAVFGGPEEFTRCLDLFEQQERIGQAGRRTLQEQVAADAATLREVIIEAPLPHLLGTLRRSGLFEGLEQFEASLEAPEEAKKALILAWFYVHNIRPREPEQVVEIRRDFEAVFGNAQGLNRWTGIVSQLEERQQMAEAIKAGLQAQVAADRATVGEVQAAVSQLRGRAVQWIDARDAASARLSEACTAARSAMDAQTHALIRAAETAEAQAEQWNTVADQCQNLSERI